jgi:hypothetical protein
MKKHIPTRPALRRLAAATLLACSAGLALPALAGKPVIDAELIRILTELRNEQREEFDKNTDRWSEVEELLAEYIEYSKAEEQRHKQWQQNQTLLSKDKKDKFSTDFKAMTAGVRDVKGKDLASQAMAAGLSTGATPGANGGIGGIDLLGFDLASLTNITSLIQGLDNPEQLLKALGVGSKAPKELEAALANVYTMWDPNKIKELEAIVQKSLAGSNRSKESAQRLIESLQVTKFNMDEAGRNLSQVQATAKGSGARLAAIEALVQQASALGAVDKDGKASYDAAKLAELRTYLASVSAMQNEELIKMQVKDMGDRASTNLLKAGGEAKRTEEALLRAGSK